MGRPNRSHYASWPSVRPSVRLFVPYWLIARTRVTGVPTLLQ